MQFAFYEKIITIWGNVEDIKGFKAIIIWFSGDYNLTRLQFYQFPQLYCTYKGSKDCHN